MADNNPDLEAQAVDEALRRDQMNALWKAYGKYVIGGAVGIVLAVGGSQLYEYQVHSTQETNSAIFSDAEKEALVEGADTVEIWQQTADKIKDGYVALADLRLAAEYAKAGNVEAALKTYDVLAADGASDKILRDYAQLLAALLVLDKKSDFVDARRRFSVLAVKGEPWYFSATEQLAFIDMKQGALDLALAQFSVLADDGDTPQTIAARARQFRDMLEGRGVGKTPVTEKTAETPMADPDEQQLSPADETMTSTGTGNE